MVIALLTDFGTQDYFVASMKGVILTINPDATIVDITHEIPPQDIDSAAFILKACYNDFPHNTVFLCVVDPGVGSERKALVVETESYKFVAPDNGLLDFVLAEADNFEAFEITNKQYLRHDITSTFHGRDIFAPAAGHLSASAPPSRLGTLISLDIQASKLEERDDSRLPIEAKIIHIDHFGNLVTNIRNRELLDDAGVEINGRQISKLYDFYAQAGVGELFLIRGSAGLVEISVCNGSAQAELGAACGNRLVIKHKTSL
jgi:S-adenosylmethionine hydrolase